MSTEENKVETAADQNDEWIVQSKPQRRLMPQHALSKQDLETDKAKAATAPAPEAKKKVIRYSKEEMMTYRQPVKMLSSMAELTEILSPERQNPVCFERFEPEDVIRIWNSEKGGPKNLEGGRGRGRGKTFKNDEGGEGQQGEWSNPREAGGSGKGGLWDDSTAAGGSGGDGLDLSDFAAMALKFRSEMETMKLSGEGGEPSALGEDAMTLLADEQSRRNVGVLEEDDDALPDWATDEPAPQPETKRSLLLDTLNIKRQPEPAAPVVVTQSVTVASATYGIGSGLDLNISSATVVSSPPPLVARVEPPTEWHYTDPAGQMQGPFPQDTMRAWHEAGYFNADLPIKLRHWQRFHPFQTVFPDFKAAFLSVPQEPGSGSLVLSLQQQQQAALLRQQQEEQRREQERLAAETQRREAEQRAQQEALRQAEIARQQEQARQAQLAEQQRQAQQLLLQQQAQQQAELEAQRALLEQQRQQQQQQKAAAAAAPAPEHKEQQQQPAASPAKPATVAPWANKQPGAQRGQDLTAIQQEEAAAREAERKRAAAEQAKITKGWSAPSNSGATLSLAEIQAQEEEQRRRQQAEAARSAPAPAPATSSMSSQLKSLLGVRAPAAPANAASTGPAWGTATGAAPAKPAASLKDIMQEEHSGQDTSAPASVAAPAAGGRKPTSWAAKAGTTTFSAPEPAAPRVTSRTPPSSATGQPAAVSLTPARAAAPAAASAPVAKPNAAKSEKSSFGGKEMSPDMANWCTAQLKRLNGSDDLTLVQFCMSLDSAAEIRQYLSEYLGSSPAVTNFATDFIKYKEGGKKALESSGVALGGAGVPISSANNNNPSNFISAGKKKSGNRNK